MLDWLPSSCATFQVEIVDHFNRGVRTTTSLDLKQRMAFTTTCSRVDSLSLLAMDWSVRQTALFRTCSSRRCSVRLRPLLLASLWLSCGSIWGLRGPLCRAQRSFSMTILDSPSAQRNKEPIWGILSEKVLSLLSEDRFLTVVEVAAGCGVHTEYFASQLSRQGRPFRWYPTDPDATSRDSIQGRIEESNINEIQSPLSLTLDSNGIVESETDALLGKGLDLIICINMIHISPWDATRGLMKVAGSKLRKGGILYCYGPYKVGGTAVESNL